MAKIACALLLLCLAVPPSLAQTLRPLYDARLKLEPAEPTAAEAALLDRTIRPAARRFWSEENCDERFQVIDVASGSFTRPGAQQRLFLYQFCTTGHGFAKNGVAVVEGNRLVGHVAFSGGWNHAVGALPDINENGLSEIIVAGGTTNTAIYTRTVSITELGRGAVRSFGQTRVQFDGCALDDSPRRPSPVRRARRLYARPGPTPAFFRDTFVSEACGAATDWTRTGRRVPTTLAEDRRTYTRLGAPAAGARPPTSMPEHLAGTWQSVDDAAWVVEITARRFVSRYDGEVLRPDAGAFAFVESCDNREPVSRSKYFTVGAGEEATCYYLVNVTEERLSYAPYHGRGNTLSFRRRRGK